MQFIASSSKSSGEVERVKNQLLDSNPVLEGDNFFRITKLNIFSAFGNAKTLRNDNSSRFVRFLKIYLKFNKNFLG